MQIQWSEDNRPELDGNFALINRRKYPTVMVQGVQRFRENRIIHDLLEAAREGTKLDLNMIVLRAAHGRYCKEEMHELYRLIGYSVCGFQEVFEDDKVKSNIW